jgi:hypothetical protein
MNTQIWPGGTSTPQRRKISTGVHLGGQTAATAGYQPRHVRALGILEVAGWRLKQYVMTVTPDDVPDPRLLGAAAAMAAVALPPATGTHGVGFLLSHQARPACFVLLDWWHGGYDLIQRYYTSPLDDPDELVELSNGAVGCVWELEVLLHERAAWIDHVLNGEADDFQAYLHDVIPAQATPSVALG